MRRSVKCYQSKWETSKDWIIIISSIRNHEDIFQSSAFRRSFPKVFYDPFKLQKQPSREVLRKKCSGNMQQIYRRILMPKCDFNKIALQLYWFWNRTSAWVFSCKFAAFFRTSFPRNTSGRLLLKIETAYNSLVSWTNFHL